MIIVAGLGNPGEEYEATRHNTGFLVLDYIAGAKDWKEVGKANALVKKVGSGKNQIFAGTD